MENTTAILEGHSDIEKGAYLCAIASLATADSQASPEEKEHLAALCDAANLSAPQKDIVLQAATELKGDELTRCLDVLKNSDLKYSLLADLLAFANSDNNYSEEEKQNVQKIADYLHINQQQFSLLDEFTQRAAALPAPETATPEKNKDWLSSLGLTDKFQKAGINPDGLLKNLIGIAGPILLAGLVSGGLGRRNRMNSGRGFGSPGGLGGLVTAGGFGSIISMLNGGRGFRNTGGLLSRILGNRF